MIESSLAEVRTLEPSTQTATLTNDGARRTARDMSRRYYVLMLNAALVAVVLGVVSAYATGSVGLLPTLLVWTAVLLVAVNLLGAAFLYRPFGRHLKGEAVTREAVDLCVRRLPLRSGLWIFFLAVVAMLGYAVAAHGALQAMTGGALFITQQGVSGAASAA